MISNISLGKASLLAFFFALMSGELSASPSIEALICDERGFSRTKVGAFAELKQDADTVYVFRIDVAELSRENLKGHELTSAARSYAAREFIRAFSKVTPPPSESAGLVADGVQTLAKKCRNQSVLLIWAKRSNLRWEISSTPANPLAVMEEAKRLIDGSDEKSLAPRSPVLTEPTTKLVPKSPAKPKVTIDDF